MQEKADLYVHPQWVHSLVCELVTQSWRAPCKSFVSFKVISAIPFTECFASKLHRVKTQVNFEKHFAHECTNIKLTLGMVTSCTSSMQPDPWLLTQRHQLLTLHDYLDSNLLRKMHQPHFFLQSIVSPSHTALGFLESWCWNCYRRGFHWG
jgi:hypothetical protein